MNVAINVRGALGKRVIAVRRPMAAKRAIPNLAPMVIAVLKPIRGTRLRVNMI